jgi:hypothetical protein
MSIKNMSKLFVSICSKINGLDTMKINFIHGEKEYSINCDYSDYDYSFYGKTLSNKDVTSLIEFLEGATHEPK